MHEKPKPDSALWWQEVAAGLGVEIGKLRAEVATLKTENETLKKRIAELTSYLDELGY